MTAYGEVNKSGFAFYLRERYVNSSRLKQRSYAFLTIASFSLCIAPWAYAEEEEGMQGPPLGWTFGAAFISNNLAYRGADADTIIVPAIGYEGENYFIRGLSAGRSLVRTREQQAWVALTLDLSRFQPGETSDPQMQLLERRNFNAQLGVGYRYQLGRPGNISVTLSTDVTGRHDGQRGQLQYSIPLNRPMQAWQVSPNIGVNYASSRYVDYYYGISEAESTRSGLPAFAGSDAFSPFIGISGYQYFNERLSLAGGFTLTRSASAIADSPMVTRGSYRTIFATLQYRF